MYCPKCGQEVGDYTQICPSCGELLDNDSVAEQNQNVSQTQEQNQYPGQDQSQYQYRSEPVSKSISKLRSRAACR